jgi:hypothetical protein
MHTPNIFDQLTLKFTSGNSVPVDRVFVTREEFLEMHKEYDDANRRVLLLIEAIAAAALQLGVIHNQAIVDGPMALMLLDDMANLYSQDP